MIGVANSKFYIFLIFSNELVLAITSSSANNQIGEQRYNVILFWVTLIFSKPLS